MTSTADRPEQTIMKVVGPPVAYALCTFEIDVENGTLLPAVTADRSGWDLAYAYYDCEPAGHADPYGGCHCGAYGYHSLAKLRASHPQAATLVAVMKYNPSRAVEESGEVRVSESTLVAYWISPDVPLRGLAADLVHDLTGKLCIGYDDLDCMLARYEIIEESDWDDEAHAVSADDGVVPVPRWAGAVGMTRVVLTTRAVRSWATVVGRPLLESFSDATRYATRTARIILKVIVIAWCAVGLHVYVSTHVTPFAALDPVLVAGHRLIAAIDTPPVRLLMMFGLGLGALFDAVRLARPLPGLADPIGWVTKVILPFVYLFAEETVLIFGMLAVLASANGHPEPGELGWCLAAMFVLIVAARSAAPLFAIIGRLRAIRAHNSDWASADV
ncbi:hypothetical protein [Mycolicibacterium sphagni]|uniref:Uncharacterized protein n=1 Tax=Mycolicibacterium sphagni TaxID=1786 RepID=A0ABX2K671_9MYCO|nr:hypothetical protein [Mycolicibacterium sphagni]NTY62578.1 hypothetical protein [Mycolicibacterium sphagni]